ncbi:hypothetical protein EYF80_044917 [Liparis tanakae]|uniref:Uncharacterized protein n=1 Tax=Liparis tanakae TaxID=230148 RepID=A0A4Z2FUB7_9TELE|nr:hypothetical protein EYF80_044917 [Liparis tanakae]
MDERAEDRKDSCNREILSDTPEVTRNGTELIPSGGVQFENGDRGCCRTGNAACTLLIAISRFDFFEDLLFNLNARAEQSGEGWEGGREGGGDK